MSDLRVGIVGLGWVAGAHIETFKHVPGATVTAVCSRRRRDPVDLEKSFGVPLRAYDDFDRMLADKTIDIVDICTPPWLHARQAIAAAKAGKHVLLEKPIALTWDDARSVRDAVKKAKVQGCVCFELRFSRQLQMTRSVVQQGLLGELHYAEVDYYHGIGPWYGQFPWNVKKDGGGSSLLSAGCHAMDALLMLMDSEVEEVTSYATRSKNKTFAPYEYPTTSTTILRFKGASGQGDVGHRLPAALLAALPPDLHDYGYVWWMRSCNRARSGASSAWTPSALTSATMIWPTSSWTSLNRPCVFIFCAW